MCIRDSCVRWYSTKDMDEKLSKKGMLRMYRRTKDCTAMIVYNDEVAGYYMAVSYTHLDVYKRQE